MRIAVAVLSRESHHSIDVGGVAVHVTELAAAPEGKGREVHLFTRPAPIPPRRIEVATRASPIAREAIAGAERHARANRISVSLRSTSMASDGV